MPTQVYTPPSNNDTLGIHEIMNYVNTVSDGFFFYALLFAIWIIVFITGKSFSSSRAFTFASFLCFILSMILTVVDLIAPRVMYLFIFLMAGGVLWMKLEAQ